MLFLFKLKLAVFNKGHLIRKTKRPDYELVFNALIAGVESSLGAALLPGVVVEGHNGI